MAEYGRALDHEGMCREAVRLLIREQVRLRAWARL
jgi:hypothetical protein